MMSRILFIEDEPGLVLTLTDRLVMQGYQVDTASDGEAGLEMARTGGYDLILLDVMLPRLSGFEVCKKLRSLHVDTPVLLLTARGQLEDKVHGLQLGADDYLTKPFEVMELLARIEALLRRSRIAAPPSKPQTVSFGFVEVNLKAGLVLVRGEPVTLSAREFQLLRFLIEHEGEIVSREELLRQVWGLQHMPITRTVDVHITWLRQKLEENPKYPRHLLTMRGLGYRFQREPA
ncbi:MAG: response regulator transcription factor [Bryobacterales bacterium]|nr:response regulator transcription factor [Bryobacterales bacterium]